MKKCLTSRFFHLFTSLMFLGLGNAYAQAGITIAPVVINLDPSRTLSSQTSFNNVTNKIISFEAKIQTWSMKDGETILSDTRDILVNPNTFQLPPGATQIIRIGLRKKPSDTELTYRLIVTQLNEGNIITNQQGIAIQILPAFSLPVYISSPSYKPAVSYGVVKDGNDLLLKATNSGNKHQTYNNLMVSSGMLTFVVPSRAVLAGANFTVRLPGFAAASAPLKLIYLDYTQVQRTETVPLP